MPEKWSRTIGTPHFWAACKSIVASYIFIRMPKWLDRQQEHRDHIGTLHRWGERPLIAEEDHNQERAMRAMVTGRGSHQKVREPLSRKRMPGQRSLSRSVPGKSLPVRNLLPLAEDVRQENPWHLRDRIAGRARS
jgi:hypothetical protein